MKVWLLTADADYDEHEAWVVLAETVEQAWSTVLAGHYEIPHVMSWDDQNYHVRSKPARLVSPGDGLTVEELGASDESSPRVAFAAFLRG